MRYVDVLAGVIWRNGRFLATQRVRGRHEGFWEFPGGKANPGETHLQTLARELYEELGIMPEEAHLWRTVQHAYEDQQYIRLHVYHVTRFSGEPQAMEKQGLCWLTGMEACMLQFLEADIPLVKELAAAEEVPRPDLSAACSRLFGEPLLEPNPAIYPISA